MLGRHRETSAAQANAERPKSVAAEGAGQQCGTCSQAVSGMSCKLLGLRAGRRSACSTPTQSPAGSSAPTCSLASKVPSRTSCWYTSYSLRGNDGAWPHTPARHSIVLPHPTPGQACPTLAGAVAERHGATAAQPAAPQPAAFCPVLPVQPPQHPPQGSTAHPSPPVGPSMPRRGHHSPPRPHTCACLRSSTLAHTHRIPQSRAGGGAGAPTPPQRSGGILDGVVRVLLDGGTQQVGGQEAQRQLARALGVEQVHRVNNLHPRGVGLAGRVGLSGRCRTGRAGAMEHTRCVNCLLEGGTAARGARRPRTPQEGRGRTEKTEARTQRARSRGRGTTRRVPHAASRVGLRGAASHAASWGAPSRDGAGAGRAAPRSHLDRTWEGGTTMLIMRKSFFRPCPTNTAPLSTR